MLVGIVVSTGTSIVSFSLELSAAIKYRKIFRNATNFVKQKHQRDFQLLRRYLNLAKRILNKLFSPFDNNVFLSITTERLLYTCLYRKIEWKF